MDEGILYAIDMSNKKILLQATGEIVRQVFLIGKDVFSRKSESAIANVGLSVTETPQTPIIAPISHQAYQPLSLTTIEPIDH